MQLFKIHRTFVIWPYILAGFLLMTIVSCGSDSPIDTEQEEEGIYASIVLAGQNIGQTRADVGEDSQDTNGQVGTSSENYININDLYVLTFSIPSGSQVLTDESKLLEIIWSPSASLRNTYSSITSNGEQIFLSTRLSSEITEYSKGDFCIVAISNIKNFSFSPDAPEFSLVKGTSFGSLRKSTLFQFKGESQNWSWMPDMTNGNGIPMFGIKQVSISGYDKKINNAGNPFPLTSNGNSVVWLLRAFAKVTVNLSDELKQLVLDGKKVNATIESVDISNQYGSEFRLIPKMSRMKGFETTGGTGQVVVEPDYSEWKVKDAPAGYRYSFTLNERKDMACIYLPEYPLTESKPKINITLNVDGKTMIREFLLKEYPPGGTSQSNLIWWNYIMRNHIYNYSVTIDYRVVTVQPTEWDNAFDNFFEFGTSNS